MVTLHIRWAQLRAIATTRDMLIVIIILSHGFCPVFLILYAINTFTPLIGE